MRERAPQTLTKCNLTDVPPIAKVYPRSSQQTAKVVKAARTSKTSPSAAPQARLANETLLTEDPPKLPIAASDRGTQMMRTTRQFFFDVGITQSFSRPRPTANAACRVVDRDAQVRAVLQRPTPRNFNRWEVELLIDRHFDFEFGRCTKASDTSRLQSNTMVVTTSSSKRKSAA